MRHLRLCNSSVFKQNFLLVQVAFHLLAQVRKQPSLLEEEGVVEEVFLEIPDHLPSQLNLIQHLLRIPGQFKVGRKAFRKQFQFLLLVRQLP